VACDCAQPSFCFAPFKRLRCRLQSPHGKDWTLTQVRSFFLVAGTSSYEVLLARSSLFRFPPSTIGPANSGTFAYKYKYTSQPRIQVLEGLVQQQPLKQLQRLQPKTKLTFNMDCDVKCKNIPRDLPFGHWTIKRMGYQSKADEDLLLESSIILSLQNSAHCTRLTTIGTME
jgi:hypothetical protein